MKKTLSNLKVVYKYGKEYKKCLIYELIGSIFGIIINIILPIITAYQLVYLTDNKWYQLIIMTMIVLGLNFISTLKTVIIRKNTQKFVVGVSEKLQKLLGKEILKISQTDLDKKSTGVFVQRMTSDVEDLSYIFTIGFGRLVGIVSSIGVFVSVLIINRYVFIYYVLVTIILTLIHLLKSKKYIIKDKQRRKKQEIVTGLTTELVRGTRDIKMLNAKESFLKVLNNNIKNKNKLNIEMRNIDIFYNFIIENLTGIFECLLIILFIYLVYTNNLSVPMAVALYSYRSKVMSNFMENISMLIDEVNGFNLSFERVFSILNNKTFNKEKFGKKALNKIKGDFEFKDVVFSYDNSNIILNKMNFKVKANETVAFVGKSGSGKTTIFNLLCKMYNVNSGEITIDNMKLVKEDVTIEEVKEACTLARLSEYIESLPNKYDTIVGEGGVNLSGGQRQRLAIARALIQKTEIILFDEATSALDNETQKKVQEAIENLKKDYTIMIIAHRFSTIINCDKIFYIEDGKVLDSGTHEELLKRCKKYKKLYESEIKETN